LIGGSGPKRTLPLVARYGDIWNGQHLTPDEFGARSAHLDELLHAIGRQPSDVKRTMHVSVFCGRDTAEVERQLRWWRRFPDFATMPLEALLGVLRSLFTVLSGPPESIVEELRAYGAVGVEEVMVQWWSLDDVAGLELLAAEVLPHLAG
jgi:alkanesulfonate monooxygenase SsuD/methylene tetrahydromethanopterin reductase-like flavin-dependent oxidoreductase (luciferase family)